MGQSWARKRSILKIRQPSCTPLQAHILQDTSKKIPVQAKECCPEVKVILFFALYSALRILNSSQNSQNSTFTPAKAVPDLLICSYPKWQIVKLPMRIKFCKYKVSSGCLERPHLFLLSSQAVCSRCPPPYPVLVCLLIVTKEENGSVGTLRKWEFWGATNVDSVDGAHDHTSVELPELTKISL